jgi:hypothetical protein
MDQMTTRHVVLIDFRRTLDTFPSAEIEEILKNFQAIGLETYVVTIGRAKHLTEFLEDNLIPRSLWPKCFQNIAKFLKKSWESVRAELGSPTTIIVLDDERANVLAAKAAGLSGILFMADFTDKLNGNFVYRMNCADTLEASAEEIIYSGPLSLLVKIIEGIKTGMLPEPSQNNSISPQYYNNLLEGLRLSHEASIGSLTGAEGEARGPKRRERAPHNRQEYNPKAG